LAKVFAVVMAIIEGRFGAVVAWMEAGTGIVVLGDPLIFTLFIL
jgi:hypothetical protein